MKNKSISVFVVIVVVSLSLLGIITILLEYNIFFEQSHSILYTTTYTNVNTDTATELINTVSNLTIIDCRGGCKPCSWNKGKIPGAVWDDNPKNYYNYTTDVLVYCKSGSKSAVFCQNLVNHTYGKIYNLIGGFDAWSRGSRVGSRVSFIPTWNHTDWSYFWKLDYTELDE